MTVAQRPEEVLFGERGTVLPHPERHNFYFVKGTETVYLVGTSPVACECAAWKYRQRCAHVFAVRRFRWQQRACPCCGGKGWLHQHPGSGFRYVKRDGTYDDGPWPLACCLGTGLRSVWERNEPRFLPGEFEHLYCPMPAVPEPAEEER